MAASMLKIGIFQNPICDNLVGFPKSGHIYAYFYLSRFPFSIHQKVNRLVIIYASTYTVHVYWYYEYSCVQGISLATNAAE